MSVPGSLGLAIWQQSHRSVCPKSGDPHESTCRARVSVGLTLVLMKRRAGALECVCKCPFLLNGRHFSSSMLCRMEKCNLMFVSQHFPYDPLIGGSNRGIVSGRCDLPFADYWGFLGKIFLKRELSTQALAISTDHCFCSPVGVPIWAHNQTSCHVDFDVSSDSNSHCWSFTEISDATGLCH
jgi:hypothetical protein